MHHLNYMNDMSNSNNKPKQRRGRNRKRTVNNKDVTVILNGFRVLDKDINNDISEELCDNVIELYSLMRVNDEKKH